MKYKRSQKVDEISLPNDFERMVPAFHKGTTAYAEHVIRYQAAQEIVRNKTVLDIACGSGYGTAMLATTAEEVIGIDVNEAAVEYAAAYYSKSNVRYLLGDGQNIPLPDASIDVVISFETIEHIQDYQKFLSEIKRILKCDGTLVLSTPNDKEFAEGNHFHLHEFEQDELQKLLKRYFKNTELYTQSTWIANALLPHKTQDAEWQKDLMVSNFAPIGKDKTLYFYFICSDKRIMYSIPEVVGIGEHWSARQIQKEQEAIGAQNHKYKEYIAYLEDQVHILSKNQNKLSSELAETRKMLSAITSSVPWRVLHIIGRLHAKLFDR